MSLVPWLEATWRPLAQRLSRNELPHALLIAGPSGLGKRALADALVAAALCEARTADGHACGACRACRLLGAGSHPDCVRVGLELRDDGKTRTEIIVDQIRALSQRLALAAQFGGLQLALIDPADAMNASAANALLKTLEEPASNTVIVLVADRPAHLPATIRSRCQRISLPLPGPDQAQAWLQAQGIAAKVAAEALAASLGNPGRALAWAGDGSLALRRACAQDLAGLRAGRAAPLAVAERWAQDRPGERLWFAAVLAREDADRLGRGEPSAFGLTGPGEIPKLAGWFGSANRVRGLLATTLRTDLLLFDLLRTWQAAR